jgi:hypothetical protein
VTALDDAPGARYFVCEHRTPELLWRPEWLAHANGATAIEAAYLVVEAGQVGAAAAAYVEITAGKLIAADDRVARIAVDGAELVISTADALAEVTGTLQITAESTGYAAIRLRTSDLAKARTYWGTQSIATVDLGPQATLIPAASANGVALIFAQA